MRPESGATLEPDALSAHSPGVQKTQSEAADPGLFRRVLVIAGILGILGFLALNQFGGRGGPVEGAPAPTFTANTLTGETFDLLDDGRGRVVVLDFWATWCTPCVKSLPALQKVHEQYRDNDDVVVASVNTDQGKGRTRRVELFVKNNRFDFMVLVDDAFELQNAYRVASIPTMVVIDKAGTVRNVKVGIQSSNTDVIAENIASLIEAAL